MVLSRRADAQDAVSSINKFDGSEEMDVDKFFFVYENVTMRGKTAEEKGADLLCYPERDAFDFYYETFAKEGVLLDAARDYSAVKSALLEHFAKPQEPEDNIRRAIAAKLDAQDLISSLRDMDRCFEKAGFNPEAKFGLLRNAVMQFPELAQFAIYPGATSYDALKGTVKDFVAGRTVFLTSRNTGMSAQVPVGHVAPKTILKRPDALERKVDALTDQLGHLSLLVKKSQSPEGGPSGAGAGAGRVCSYCRRAGHGANRCDMNPDRDTRCPRCQKFGHSEATCWMKITPEMTRKVGFQGIRSEPLTEEKLSTEGKDTPDKVAVVTEPDTDAVVAAAKRNAAGEALPKQQKTNRGVPIPSLLNPSLGPIPMQVTPKPKRRIRKEKAKKKIKTRKPGIPEHVGKYNVLEELARAPSGLTFGQLIRGDADEAKLEIREALAKGARATRSVIAHIGNESHPRRLKVVSVRVYGTVAQALLDSGAVPNLMSSTLADTLSLSPLPTSKRITVADGSNAVLKGFLTAIPVSFGSIRVPLDFLIVEGTPIDIIIGCPALEMMQARLDMGEQHVTITIGDQIVQLGLEYDYSRIQSTEDLTKSEEFTSESEDEDSELESDDDNWVVAILETTPFEPDLALNHKHNEEDDDDEGMPPLIDADSDSEDDDDGEMPALLEVEPDSESEDEGEEDEPATYVGPSEEAQTGAGVTGKFSHIPSSAQEMLVDKLQDSGIVAWTLDDLRPADVPGSTSLN